MCIFLKKKPTDNFELEGASKPLEFRATARRLTFAESDEVSGFCLVLLANRRRRSMLSVASNMSPRASVLDDTRSTVTALSTFANNPADAAAAIKATLDSVSTIDAEIVLVCNRHGVILEKSALADVLLEVHGAGSAELLSASLDGGQMVNEICFLSFVFVILV